MTEHGYSGKRSRTRRRLIEAGYAVVADRGVQGATVALVAAEAEVSAGTVYNHFASLADLIDAVTAELLGALGQGDARLGAGPHDAAARAAVGARRLLALVADDRRAAAALVALVPSVPEFRAGVRALIADAVAAGLEAGRFRVVEVDTVADAALGALVQWIRTDLQAEGPPPLARPRIEVLMAMLGLDPAEVEVVLEGVLGGGGNEAADEDVGGGSSVEGTAVRRGELVVD